MSDCIAVDSFFIDNRPLEEMSGTARMIRALTECYDQSG